MADPKCVFCRLTWAGAYEDCRSGVAVIRPLHPVVAGHLLMVPVRHVADALEDPALSAAVMRQAAVIARERKLSPCNIMTSVGAAATQSVFHLHFHIVPRAMGDGLMLPWSEQQAKEAEAKASA
jgi:histidine triad (HIT) family protein